MLDISAKLWPCPAACSKCVKGYNYRSALRGYCENGSPDFAVNMQIKIEGTVRVLGQPRVRTSQFQKEIDVWDATESVDRLWDVTSHFWRNESAPFYRFSVISVPRLSRNGLRAPADGQFDHPRRYSSFAANDTLDARRRVLYSHWNCTCISANNRFEYAYEIYALCIFYFLRGHLLLLFLP